jgi:hypothetical protein
MPVRAAFRSAAAKSLAIPTNANPCALFLVPLQFINSPPVSGARRDFLLPLARQNTELKTCRQIAGRIEALANLHSLFIQSRRTGAELGRLLKHELSPYSRAGEIRTLINGPAVRLKPDVTQAMAVAHARIGNQCRKLMVLYA